MRMYFFVIFFLMRFEYQGYGFWMFFEQSFDVFVINIMVGKRLKKRFVGFQFCLIVRCYSWMIQVQIYGNFVKGFKLFFCGYFYKFFFLLSICFVKKFEKKFVLFSFLCYSEIMKILKEMQGIYRGWKIMVFFFFGKMLVCSCFFFGQRLVKFIKMYLQGCCMVLVQVFI